MLRLKWPCSNRASRRSYLDFEIQVFKSDAGIFYAQVLHSPAGQSPRDRLDFDLLRSRLKAYYNITGDIEDPSVHANRNVVYQAAEATRPLSGPIAELGAALFEFLFTGTLGHLYYGSVERAEAEGQGLRLKMRIEAPELAALPWEIMFHSLHRRYVGLWNDTPVIRYIALPLRVRPLAVKPPFRILGLIADPGNPLSQSLFEEEVRHMKEALKELEEKGLVELSWVEGQTLQLLREELRKEPKQWHILHFIGHGGFDDTRKEGYIVLADEEGNPQRVEARHLAVLLASHKSLRFAFLNSCDGARGNDFGSTATALVWADIPAVLAMRTKISNQAAIEFSRAFYEALADRWPVDAAVAEARKAINLRIGNMPEWATPQLYSRSPDGEVFARKSESLKCIVTIILILACLVALVWYFFTPVPITNKNINANINTPPVKPTAKIIIDRVLARDLFREIEGHIENLPAEAKIWLFRRNDGTALWESIGAALIEGGNWSMEVPVRPRYVFPHHFEIAALVSPENFPPGAKLVVLPSEGVSSVQSGAVPQPEYSIARINGVALQRTARCAIVPWQQNTFEGSARHIFEDENIWLNVFGQDKSHIQTGRWTGSATVNPHGKWTANVRVAAGQSFEIYIVISQDDPGTDPSSQGVPVKCAGR